MLNQLKAWARFWDKLSEVSDSINRVWLKVIDKVPKIWLMSNFLRLTSVVRSFLLVRGAMVRGGMVGGRKELSKRLFSEPKRAETRKVRFLVNILMSNIKFPKFPGKVDWALYCAPVKLMENSTLISQVCSSKWPLSYAAGLRKSCGPPCPLLRQSHFDCAIHLLRFIS